MGILFTAVGDVPHLLHWDDWARLALSTLGTMIALRNLLVSMYEASRGKKESKQVSPVPLCKNPFHLPHPSLKPSGHTSTDDHGQHRALPASQPDPPLPHPLHCRCAPPGPRHPRQRAPHPLVLHALRPHGAGREDGQHPRGVDDGVPRSVSQWSCMCHAKTHRSPHPNTRTRPQQTSTVFFYNLILKLGSWQLFLLYEGRLKRAVRKRIKEKQRDDPRSGGWSIFRGGAGDRGVALGRRQVALLRRLRKGIVLYYAASDLGILLCVAAQHLVLWEGQELLRIQQRVEHDPHSYDELERRVVAFNWCVSPLVA